MTQILASFRRLSADKRGVTALEYGLIAALVAIACVSGLKLTGTSLASTFNRASVVLTAAN